MAKFTTFELGWQDFERGEPRGPGGWDGQRVKGWDAARAYYTKRADGPREPTMLEREVAQLARLHRVRAGDYVCGPWRVVEQRRRFWSLIYDHNVVRADDANWSSRGTSLIDNFPTFAEAEQAFRNEVSNV